MESPRGSGRSGGSGGARGPTDSVEATPARHSPHRLNMVHSWCMANSLGTFVPVLMITIPRGSTSCAMVAMITPQFEPLLWPLWEGNAFKHESIPGGWMRHTSRKLKSFAGASKPQVKVSTVTFTKTAVSTTKSMIVARVVLSIMSSQLLSRHYLTAIPSPQPGHVRIFETPAQRAQGRQD